MSKAQQQGSNEQKMSSPSPPGDDDDDGSSQAVGSNTLLEEIREVLAQSYLIFLLADLRLMSGTGRIRTKYETLVIDSDLYPRTTSKNLAGLVQPTTSSSSARGVSMLGLGSAGVSTGTGCSALDPSMAVQKRALHPVQIMAILLMELKETFEGHAKQKEERKRHRRSTIRKNQQQKEYERQQRSQSRDASDGGLSSHNEDSDDDDRSDQDDQFIYYQTSADSKRQAEDSMESLLRAYSRMVANDLKVQVPHIRKRRIPSSIHATPDMMMSAAASPPGGGGISGSMVGGEEGNVSSMMSGGGGQPVIFVSDRHLMKKADLNIESGNEFIDPDDQCDYDYNDESLSMMNGDDLSIYQDDFSSLLASSTSKTSSDLLLSSSAKTSSDHFLQQQQQQPEPQNVTPLHTPPSSDRSLNSSTYDQNSNRPKYIPAMTATTSSNSMQNTVPARPMQRRRRSNESPVMISRRHSNDDGRGRRQQTAAKRAEAATGRRHSNESQASSAVSPNDSKKQSVQMASGNVFNLDSIHEGHHDDDSDGNDKSFERSPPKAAGGGDGADNNETVVDFGGDNPNEIETVSRTTISPGQSATVEFHTPYKGDGEESVFSLKSATTAPPNLEPTAVANNSNIHANGGDEHTNTTAAASATGGGLDPLHEQPQRYNWAAMRANFSASKRQEMAENIRARRAVARQQYAERREQLRQEFAARRQQLRHEFTDRIDNVMRANANPRSPNRDGIELEFQELTNALFEMGADPEGNMLGLQFRESLGIDNPTNATDKEIMQVMKRAVESRQPARLNFMSNLFKPGSVSQLMVESSSKIVWMNDWYPLKDLTYAIAVDQQLKRVLVVFRGAITKADWQSARKASFTSVLNPVKEDFPGKSKRILVFSGLYKYLFRARKDTGTTKYDEIANLAHKYGKEMIGDGYNLTVCGHSLGGALSVYFSLHASTDDRFTSNGAVKSFAFGTPYLGNHYFADAFRHQERQGKLQCVRIFNHNDAIPHLPFNFIVGKRGCRWRHVGIEVSIPSVPWWGWWSPRIRYNGAKEKNWLQSTIHGYRQNVFFHYPWLQPWAYQRMHTLFELQDRLMYGIETKKKGGSFGLLQKTVDDLYAILAETDFTTLRPRKE